MKSLHDWWTDLRYPPVVLVFRTGQDTPQPRVCVSVWSRRGRQNVYEWDANSMGEAKATMYGRDMAYILGVQFIDERLTEAKLKRG